MFKDGKQKRELGETQPTQPKLSSAGAGTFSMK